MSSSRLDDIDRGKGIAIALVVFGHIVARDLKPLGNEWYPAVNNLLYSFHMAFFFYLSGVVTFFRGALPVAPGSYPAFLGTRVKRLLPAYLLFAVIVFLGKWGASYVVHVDRSVSLSWWEAANLILYPTQSYSSSLWYIVALLLVCATVPVWMWLLGNRPWLLVAWTLVLNLVGGPEFLALHQVARYSLFFVLGWLWVLHREFLSHHLERFWLVWLAAFALCLLFMPSSLLPLGAGLLSLPALHGLASHTTGRIGRCFAWLGQYSFPIYLMNTIAIGLVKGISLKLVSWDGVNFLFYVPILTLAGLLIPVAIKKWIFPHLPYVDRITR